MGKNNSKQLKEKDSIETVRRKRANKKLSPEEVQELVEKTYFSKKELKKWYKDFVRDCPTGELKMDEFQNIYKQFFPNGDPSKFAAFVFNVFDCNQMLIRLGWVEAVSEFPFSL
uniref:EF-hand domain-containing protein n=1 Tax=Heterorhabditis bacteriophora TaxID=37862 RepID=A0A1I7XCK7_HETBA